MAENRVSLQFPIFNPEQLAGNTGNYKLPSGMVVFVTKEVDGVLKYFIRVGDGQTELKNLANIGIDDHLKVKSLVVGTGEASDKSVAEGYNTKATGPHSHAEGSTTEALGQSSHAEGWKTKVQANAEAGHAEGYMSIAKGEASHAEGSAKEVANDVWENPTIAEGFASHAEGVSTKAIGQGSHSEGYGSEAKSQWSHAEGWETEANGAHSHAEGSTTKTGSDSAHAEGWYSQANGEASHAEGAATIASKFGAHAEGGPESYTESDGTYTIIGPTTASGEYAHAEGQGTTASGKASHAGGHGTIASGDYQTVIGTYNEEDSSALFIIGDGSSPDDSDRHNILKVKENSTEINSNLSVKGIVDIKSNAGSSIFQVGTYQVTINKPVKVNSSTFSLNNKQVATQEYVQTKIAEAELAGGDIDTSNLVTKIELAEAVQDAMQGYVATDINDDECYEAIQIDITADDKLTLSGKNGSQKIILENGVQIVTSGAGTHTDKLTTSNELKTTGSFIIGKGVASELSIAGGTTTIDDYADKAGLTTAEIWALKAAIATAGGLTESIASAPMSIALGPNNESTVTGAITLGYGNKNSGFNSIAVGAINEVTGNSAFAYGYKNIVSGDFGVVFGQESQAGEMGFAGGVKSHATGKGAFAFGNETQATNEYAHAEGGDTTASGKRAHAEGNSTVASGSYAHSEGTETIASGTASHAEGGPRIDKNGKSYQTKASGNYSHAEGAGTTASGHASHAEGENTTASNYAHAEGYGTNATGPHSHAEGSTTLAQGMSSHAEGWKTQALNEGAHAQGYETVASGEASFAGGNRTIASQNFQTALGTYNAENEDALFIVGNGEDADHRSNAFVVNKDGTATLSKGPTEDMDVATKAYVDGVFSDIDFSGLVTEDMLDDYYTKSQTEAYVDDAIKTVDFSGLVTEAMLDDYVTEDALDQVIGTADDDANTGTIYGKINGIEAEIDDIITTTNDAYAVASEAKTVANEFSAKVEQLETIIDGKENAITTLQGRVDTIEADYVKQDDVNKTVNELYGQIESKANEALEKASSAVDTAETAITRIEKVFTLSEDYEHPTIIKGPLQFEKADDKHSTYLQISNENDIRVGSGNNYDNFALQGYVDEKIMTLDGALKNKSDTSHTHSNYVDQSAINKINQTAEETKQYVQETLASELLLKDVLNYDGNTWITIPASKGIKFAENSMGIQVANDTSIEIMGGDYKGYVATQLYVTKKIADFNEDLDKNFVSLATLDNYARIKTIDNKDTKDSNTIKGVRLYVDDKVSVQNNIISGIQSTIGQNSETSGNTVFARVNQMEGLYEGLNNTVTTHGTEITNIKTSLTNGVKYLGTTNKFAGLRSDVHTGDFYRVSGTFTFGNETAHVGDILIATKNAPATNTSDWDLIHTEMDNDTWKQNTASSDGYVSKSDGKANKVWKTNSAGEPAWRDDYVHPTSNVSPGTYTKVTVDKYGHITSAQNPSTLADYGITDAATQSSLNAYAKKATTLSGYEIADAYTKTQVDSKLSGYATKSTTLGGYGITNAYTKYEIGDILSGYVSNQNVVDMRTEIANNKTNIDSLVQNLNGILIDMSRVTQKDDEQDLELTRLNNEKANSDSVYTKAEMDARFANIATHGDPNTYAVTTNWADGNNSLEIYRLDGYVTTIYVMLDNGDYCEENYATITLPTKEMAGDHEEYNFTYKRSTSAQGGDISMNNNTIVVYSSSSTSGQHGVVEIKIYKNFMSKTDKGQHQYMVDWKIIK